MTYDVIIIGGGPGGYVAAIRAAQQGMRAAIIADELGGACLHRGCIPTKTLLHLTHLYKSVEQAKDMGINHSDLSHDITKMHERKADIISRLEGGIAGLVNSNGVDHYNGRGRLLAPYHVDVGGQVLKSKHIIMATGARPAMPVISGIDSSLVYTSNDLLEAPRDFKRLAILGGGVIGVEFASIYGNLGAKVVVIESEARLLPQMDRDMGMGLAQNLKQRGVALHLSTRLEHIRCFGGALELELADKKGKTLVDTDALLVAVGRKPNITAVDAKLDGLTLGKDGGIVVDSNYMTGVDGLYAIGDCVSGNPQLAHYASAQATNCIAQIAGKPAPVDLALLPSCIYCDPEIAIVGLTENEAKAKGMAIRTSKYLMGSNPKHVIEDLHNGRGFIKLIVSKDRGIILGAALMMPHASDIVGELALAIQQQCRAQDLSRLIHPHPSFVEGVLEAADNLLGHAVHINKL